MFCCRGDHTEVIEIDYDPEKVSYEKLLELFWNNHEYGVTTFIKRQVISLFELKRHLQVSPF